MQKQKQNEKYFKKDTQEKIELYLDKNNIFTKDVRRILSVANIFFLTKEYNFSEKYILPVISKLTPKKMEEKSIISYLYYCLAIISLHKADYRSSNEYFIKSYETQKDCATTNEKTFLLISWINIFIESGYIDYAEQLLTFISTNIFPKQDDNYARILFFYFLCHKKQNNLDSAINWVNLLIPMCTDFLDIDDWYTIHIFAGEYYASIRKNFEKSIYHFTLANSFLSIKWKIYINNIGKLKNHLKIADYLNIRIAYEDKMHELILENNLHSSHYLHSLKYAYEELKNLYNQVHEMSIIDNLTSLNNRHYLWGKAPEFISLAYMQNISISCIMIDIDDFKQINDEYGHQAGDEIIKQVGKIVKNYFRKTDIIVRFGGEEIIVLLLKSRLENTQNKCLKLQQIICNHKFIAKNQTIKVSVSIGISHKQKVKNQVQEIENLIDEADKAMYESKVKGKNQVSIYKK